MLVARSCRNLCTLIYGHLPARLPCPWNSPGKNTGVGCHSLLQGIFPTQGLNLGLLHCRQILYCLNHQGSPLCFLLTVKIYVLTPPNTYNNIACGVLGLQGKKKYIQGGCVVSYSSKKTTHERGLSAQMTMTMCEPMKRKL